MDSIYSNKKYLQSLNAADYYRGNNAQRPPANEYACGSYQNTMSRRSLFGAYAHQPNMSKYSYPSDVSLSSHYGYTSWGLWRDTGHLSPSVYSKKRINIRSFSILIMSAAFIVLLAVLSVAALAFYFSTFKSDSNESTLVFDCLFRIAKGDVYTSGLKYNHTTVYRQKAAFYTKFIETSLEHGSFNVAKTEINGFGAGPDIQLSFRIYLDMRKIQMTITNVEDHIKNAFISETAMTDSTFRSLKIDDDTIEIKRQLDPEVLRQAAFFREMSSQDMITTAPATTVIPLDDLSPPSSSSKKLTTSTEKAKSKLSTATSAAATSKYTNSNGRKKDSHKPIHEIDVDMENLPVIQGSFEITKTDADIAQKRSNANQRPASTASLTPNTLKPFFISPSSSIKIKADERQATVTPATKPGTGDSVLEMFLQHQKQQIHPNIKESPVTAKIEKTNKNGETTIAKAHPTLTTTTTTTVIPTTTESVVTSPSSSSPSPTTTDEYKAPHDLAESQINKDLPKLDVSLFTSAPVLDREPWRPINPSPSQIKANFPTLTTEASVVTSSDSPDIFRSPFNPNSPENVMYRSKFVDPDMMYPLNDTNDSVFYQSFYNPDFSAGDLAIEKLGIADVKPYPLPVNKIDLSENQSVPDFKPLTEGESIEKDGTQMNYDEDKFEHLGGGVIAKKPEATDNTTNDESKNDTLGIIHDRNGDNETEVEKTKPVSEEPTELGDIFQELLNLDEVDDVLDFNKTEDNKLESRVAPEDSLELSSEEQQQQQGQEQIPTTTERLNFMNMKDFIVQMQQNQSDDVVERSSESSSAFEMISASSMGTTEKPTTTFVEVETFKYTPPAVTHTTASQYQLFPMISKWEFVNGTQVNATESSITKKVFNETLQAVIVENSQTTPHASRVEDLKANRTVDKANLQQLSSIFDTLAAKLGIKPTDVASKMPPFSQHNKLKNNSNRTRSPTKKSSKISSTTSISKQRPTTTKLSQTKATTVQPSTTKLATPSTTTRIEVVTDGSSPYESSSESMVGQAEVEPVDPTKYDEILSLISSSPVTRFTSTTPSLVTLLPVKSNSGIRNFNPRIKLPSRPQSSDETRNMETVVKTSMTFDS